MELCDKYMHEYILLNPSMNDYIRLENYDHLRNKFTNTYSDEYSKKDEKIVTKYIKLLKNKKQKTYYDKLFYHELKNDIKMGYFESEYFPISSLDNIYLSFIYDIKSSDSDYQFSDSKSYKDFIYRLKNINEITKSIIDILNEGIKSKVLLPDIIVHRIIVQMESALKQNTKQNNYNHYRKIPSKIKNSFLETIDKYLILNIKKITEFLINEYSQHCKPAIGLCNYRNGKKYYRDIVKNLTFKDYTPEKIHTLGINEVKKYITKLKTLQNNMNISGNYNDFIKKVSKHKSSKNVFSELHKIQLDIIKNIYPKYFNGEIDKDDYYQIKRVTAEEEHTSAYYLLPDLKNERKGTFFINTLKPDNVNIYELPTLSLHEGIPGHHYENIINKKSDKPLYFRSGCNYIAYSEGWGLYCESLLEPKNNYEIFWNLIYHLHRCIRLVLDTGIHYYSWSYEKSFQYMNQYLPFSDPYIKNEIYRYIDDPGQAITYKIGELTIQELKKEYFKKNKGDYKGFHELYLKIGPCPLDVLKERFMSYL